MPHKEKKGTNSNLRKIPFYLRNSLSNLLNRESTSEENLSTIECSDLFETQGNTSNITEQNFNLEHPITSEVKIIEMPNPENSANPSANVVHPPLTGATTSAAALTVFNSLKIPDAVKDLPKFDGNPRLLYDFIENVEEILSIACSINGTPCGRILLRAIRNKVEGPANEVLNMYGTPLEWTTIKNNLILHYSDKRNETSLIKDLHNLKQLNKSVGTFYSEIIELQATMSNHIQIHETDRNVVEAKKNLFGEMCLNVFLTGLKEPLGSTIRAMQPTSLPEAFTYCVKEQNIFYAKSEQPINNQKLKSVRSPQFPRLPVPPPRFPAYPRFSQPTIHPQFFSNQNNNRQFNQQFTQPFYQPYNQPFNRPITHPPNPQPRPQFSQQFRHFTPNPINRPNLPKPEPMDTSSGLSRFRKQNHPSAGPNNTQTNNRPNFISEELFNLDEQNSPTFEDNLNIYTNDHYYTNLDRYYDNYSETNPEDNLENIETTEHQPPEIDEANFPTEASMNPLDT